MAKTNTKTIILEVAARHFAQHGYRGTSVREITKELGINVAAIHYHFGSKEGVYHAVVFQFFNQIREERMALLTACEKQSNDDPRLLESIFNAMIAPHVRLVNQPGGVDYLRILSRFNSEPHDITMRVYEEEIDPVRQRIIRVLGRAMPHLPGEELYRAFGFVAILMASALFDAGYETLSGKTPIAKGPDELIESLVTFAAAGFRALAAQKTHANGRESEMGALH